MPARIEVQHLSFSYEHRPEPVFENLSFAVNSGEVLCLLGPNGTGKSTLMKCLCGILRPGQGAVLLDAQPMSTLRPSAVARTIGYVPQGQQPVFPFLVRDVVVMGRAAHLNAISSPSAADYAIADTAIATTGIQHLAEKACNNISSGEWQLVLIARALAQQPRILLLDEPTSHLDMGKQMRILEVINQLAKSGLTIVMATHFPDHAFMTGHRTAILKDGRLLALGSPEEVITPHNLRQAYGVEVKIITMNDGLERTLCVPYLHNDTDSG